MSILTPQPTSPLKAFIMNPYMKRSWNMPSKKSLKLCCKQMAWLYNIRSNALPSCGFFLQNLNHSTLAAGAHEICVLNNPTAKKCWNIQGLGNIMVNWSSVLYMLELQRLRKYHIDIWVCLIEFKEDKVTLETLKKHLGCKNVSIWLLFLCLWQLEYITIPECSRFLSLFSSPIITESLRFSKLYLLSFFFSYSWSNFSLTFYILYAVNEEWV